MKTVSIKKIVKDYKEIYGLDDSFNPITKTNKPLTKKQQNVLMQEMMARFHQMVKEQEENYLRYLKSLNHPNEFSTFGGLWPMIKHECIFVATHTLDEENILIWECACGNSVSSM